jgi:hypothetical protein
MKLARIVTFCAGLMFVAITSSAQRTGSYRNNQLDLYRADELDVDFFGSYLNREGKFNELLNTDANHGTWGGGVGLGYFFTRELGLGADVNFSDHPGRITDQATGNLLLRLPIGSSGFAPYIFGGGGRTFSPDWEWVYGVGVGVELRFSRQVGIFADGRFLWSDVSSANDRGLVRAGVRVAF